ncbi:MAG: hypothetical protein M5R36_09455 [Deltaproteobacteria bacterium]|nr:hypothetical protein [Deltaproteobacteria bacterium]
MKKVLDCLESHRIRSLGFFMIGNPGETEETVHKTISLAKSLPLHYTQFTLTMIKPHTDLEQKYIFDAMGYDYWREYLRGNVEEQILPTPWTELSRADIERLTKKAYLSFYLRPRYALKMIARIESLEEFKRYVRVAVQMMFRPLRPAKMTKLPIWRRCGRFVFAFLDGLLATMNQGGRHPVAFFGGGVKGRCGARCTSGSARAAPRISPRRAAWTRKSWRPTRGRGSRKSSASRATTAIFRPRRARWVTRVKRCATRKTPTRCRKTAKTWRKKERTPLFRPKIAESPTS